MRLTSAGAILKRCSHQIRWSAYLQPGCERGGRRVVPEALVGERPEPEQRPQGRQTGCRQSDCGAPPFAKADDGVRGERNQREERIGRVHERQFAERSSESKRKRPRSRLEVGEEEGNRHRYEQLLRSGGRKSEQRPRSAMTGGEAIDAELCGEDRQAGRRRVEHGDP